MSSTVKWTPQRARVVITLNVEISHGALHDLPPWQRSATAAVREIAEGMSPTTGMSPTRLIGWLRRSRQFTVIEERIEVF